MCEVLDRRRQTILERLEYYSEVIPGRIPGYGELKRSKVIPQLHRALVKLNEGSSSECDDCGAEIPVERFELLPGAIRCVDCQTVFEQGR